MHLCNMLIYLLSLCALICAVLSMTSHAVTTYFACMQGQKTTLPSDCQVSTGPLWDGLPFILVPLGFPLVCRVVSVSATKLSPERGELLLGQLLCPQQLGTLEACTLSESVAERWRIMRHFPTFLGTAPKPENQFLTGLEENGPRIWLAKHYFLSSSSITCVCSNFDFSL